MYIYKHTCTHIGSCSTHYVMFCLWAWYCPQDVRSINKDTLSVIHDVSHHTSTFSLVLQPHILMHVSYIYYCSYISICVFKQCDTDHLERGVRIVQSRKWPQATGWMIQGLIPGRCKRCFLQLSTLALHLHAPQPTPSQWALETLSPRIRQLWHEANHTPLSTAIMKTFCSYMSSHPTCPHGRHNDNFYHLESSFPKSKIVTQQQDTVQFISYSARLT